MVQIKALASGFDDIQGYIMKAMNRGTRSKYHVSTENIGRGQFLQKFKTKSDDVIAKVYDTNNGTMTTALFKGEKAKLIDKKPLSIYDMQPDKHVQSVREIYPDGTKIYGLTSTEITQKQNLFEIGKCIQKPNVTKSYLADSELGESVNTFATMYEAPWHYKNPTRQI